MSLKSALAGIGKFALKILNVRGKNVHTTPIPEDLKKDKVVKELTLENTTLKAQIARTNAEIREKKEEVKEEELEEEIKEKLQEQSKRFKEEKLKRNVSFGTFYNKFLSKARFRNKLEVTDKYGEHIFGKFKDFRIIEGEKFALFIQDEKNTEKGRLLVSSRILNQVLYKPLSLGKRYVIAIPYNKDLQYLPDLDNVLIHDVTPNADYDPNIEDSIDNKPYALTSEYEAPFIDLLLKREELISEKNNEIERLERTLRDMHRKVANISRQLQIYKKNEELASVDLSKATNMSIQHMSQIGEWNKRLTVLQEDNLVKEDILNSLSRIKDTLMDKAERSQSQTKDEIAIETLTELQERLKHFAPRVVHEHIESEPEPKELSKPGGKI